MVRTYHKQSTYQQNIHTPHTEQEVIVEEKRRRRGGEHRIWEEFWYLWHLINISCCFSDFLGKLKTCAPVCCVSVTGNSHLKIVIKVGLLKQH